MCDSVMHHLYIVLSAHRPKSSLFLSPFIPRLSPLPPPPNPFPAIITIVWPVSVRFLCFNYLIPLVFSPSSPIFQVELRPEISGKAIFSNPLPRRTDYFLLFIGKFSTWLYFVLIICQGCFTNTPHFNIPNGADQRLIYLLIPHIFLFMFYSTVD